MYVGIGNKEFGVLVSMKISALITVDAGKQTTKV